MQEKLLAARLKLLGEENPETVKAMDGLAEVLFDLERYPEAQRFPERILAGQRRVLGESHPATFETMEHLAITLRRQGLTEPADEMDRQLVDLRGRVRSAE